MNVTVQVSPCEASCSRNAQMSVVRVPTTVSGLVRALVRTGRGLTKHAPDVARSCDKNLIFTIYGLAYISCFYIRHAGNANRSADTSKKEGNMKFIFEYFPGTFTYAVLLLIAVIFNTVAAEQSVQLTALINGIFGVLSGMGFGIIWAASTSRRN